MTMIGLVADGADAQQVAQPDQRRDLAAQPQHVAVARQGFDRLGVELHRLHDARKREDEALGSGPHDHAVQHRQGERKAEREAAAPPGRGFDRDASAQGLDVPAHHVHADAAAGHVRHRGGGGQAGVEDQVVGLLGRRLGVRLEDAARLGLLDEALAVDAAPVVGDADEDARAAVLGGDADGSFRALAGRRRSSGISSP